MKTKLQAANLPHWFPEFKAILVTMAGNGMRPLISQITANSVRVRYPSKFAYQDPTIFRRLYNVANRNKLAIKWNATVQGLYVTIGSEDVIEESTGASV